jgi:putative transcription factor
VCESCAKFGKAIFVKQNLQNVKPIKKDITEIISLVNSNYPIIVKNAREKQGLKQEELAKKIDEKTSLIHKVETGSMQPTILLAKKLEKVLNIKLIEVYEETHETLNFKNSDLTIGDLIREKN